MSREGAGRLGTPGKGGWREPYHLAGLSALAIAHPVLQVIGSSAAYFVALRAGAPEAGLLVAVVMLLPPAVLAGLLLVAGRFSPEARSSTQVLIVQGLLAALLVPPLHRAGLAHPYLVAVPAGLLGALAYHRFGAVKELVSFLGVALVAVPLAFAASPAGKDLVLHGLGASADARGHVRPAERVARPLPLIVLLFDEFPLGVLLDDEGQINAKRYPGFADLASVSTWYRDATSVSESTVIAVPSILKGRRVTTVAAPTLATHPDNLLNLLSGSHRVVTTEYWTDLAPHPDGGAKPTATSRGEVAGAVLRDAAALVVRLLMPDARSSLATLAWVDRHVPSAWERPHEAGPRLFKEFVDSLEPGSKPLFRFCHLMMPHAPYVRLPSGQRYARTAKNLAESGLPDDDVAQRLLQRAALQVGDADRRVTALLARLRTTGLLDVAVVVVMADHGIAFRGGSPHRDVKPETLEEIAPVPFFIHVPGEAGGRVVDAPVQVTDLAPTLAEGLGVEIPWPVDGVPAHSVDAASSRRRAVSNRSARVTEFEERGLAVRAARRYAGVIGAGGWDEVWRIGPRRELVFEEVSKLEVVGRSEVEVRWSADGEVEGADPEADFVPALVTVELERPEDATVVVALNGRVGAAVELKAGRRRAELLLPPTLFRKGGNRLQFLIEDPKAPRRFLPARAGPLR